MDTAANLTQVVSTLDANQLRILRRILVRLIAQGGEHLRLQALSLLPLVEAELALRTSRP
jgi:hypothetical protein